MHPFSFLMCAFCFMPILNAMKNQCLSQTNWDCNGDVCDKKKNTNFVCTSALAREWYSVANCESDTPLWTLKGFCGRDCATIPNKR